ncbi:hypothetical protein Pden_2373 [Paracoccus denitrificans PD1222]|uniref:Uncharacterized protein n=1 Tax=Paracoccus denitrificans (strain Pd 1222) TaxID=318586 RepID=A1B4L9_PARDP|nr:hypothetical protein Pden_2373 [Paracoccus denitrificans PD1222]
MTKESRRPSSPFQKYSRGVRGAKRPRAAGQAKNPAAGLDRGRVIMWPHPPTTGLRNQNPPAMRGFRGSTFIKRPGDSRRIR